MEQDSEQFDVVIIGAGLSGICAAFHFQSNFPNKKYAILETRENMGGTWDLFKYPGIRSDSDMYTLGFSFHPWKNAKAIADGNDILSYIKETAQTYEIEKHIQFSSKVTEASWTDESKNWSLKIDIGSGTKTIRTKFVISCTGYYDYEEGYLPKFPGIENFQGTTIHPQFWDANLDYSNKKIVVIGSGATAVTLVPELAKKASHVTMLQRSPTYILNLPSEDIIANFLKKIMPLKWAHNVVRWKNIMISIVLYWACRKWPKTMRKFFKKEIAKFLGDDYNDKDFDPKYDPWDQRLCLIPDNDLFISLKEGTSEIVTDTIESFTSSGIQLTSGKHIEADIVITATGLKLKLLGGIKAFMNGEAIKTGDLKAYKGVMFSDVPNLAVAVGYTNASWTLKCDLNCHFVVKVLKYMEKNDFKMVAAKFDASKFGVEPLLDFDAGYIKRSLDILPKQGSKKPWKVHQNYIKDLFSLKYSTVNDEYLNYE